MSNLNEIVHGLTARQRVERGAAKFDELFGEGWEHNFEKEELNGINCTRCAADIASGLDGSRGYSKLLRHARSIDTKGGLVVQWGCCATFDQDGLATEKKLLAAWKELITERLALRKILAATNFSTDGEHYGQKPLRGGLPEVISEARDRCAAASE